MTVRRNATDFFLAGKNHYFVKRTGHKQDEENTGF